jgi:CRP-like cAMP-binding protein
MNPLDNLILAALPEGEREALLALMHPVTLVRGELLYEQDALVHDAYFFTSGAASLLILMENGSALEPAIIGREGMLGFPIGLGENRSRWRSVIQIEGEALVIPRSDLSRQLRVGGDLPALLTHYAGLLITFVAQSAACAQFHSLEQRTARWLLLMHDRARGDDFAITQEYLAFMLGAHRPSETLALHALSERGILGLRRGHIRILDRAALLAETCECYARVQIQYAESVEVQLPDERPERGRPYPDTDRPRAEDATPPPR